MNIYQVYFEKRASVAGISILEKLANIAVRNEALRSAMIAAKNKNYASAAGTLLTDKPAREEALRIAQTLKQQGRLDSLPSLKSAVPDTMPGMLGRAKLSKDVLSTIAKNRGNDSFKSELRKIIADLG